MIFNFIFLVVATVIIIFFLEIIHINLFHKTRKKKYKYLASIYYCPLCGRFMQIRRTRFLFFIDCLFCKVSMTIKIKLLKD